MDAGPSAQVADMGAEHSAGTCVAERERCEVSSPSPPTKQRSLRVVYVLNDGLKSVMASSPESGALQCLQRACDAESALLTTVTFGRLDFGETSVLDSFYDAGVCQRNNPAFLLISSLAGNNKSLCDSLITFQVVSTYG